MSNTSLKLEDTNVSEVAEIPSRKPASKRVPDASEPISQHEGEEITEVPVESKEENLEEPSKSVPEPGQDAKILQPQEGASAASSPKPTKSVKRTREEYEEPEPDAEEANEERLPPLPIPKRTASSKSVLQAKEPSDISEKSVDSSSAEEVPLPSSASDASETPSTAVNEETEASPKLPAESGEEGHLTQRVSKRRRITDTFKGLFNVFGDSVSSALSFALERST